MSKHFGARGVINFFARGGGVLKFFFRVGLEGGKRKFFIADIGLLDTKLVPAKFFFSTIFFLKKKKRRQLKKLKIWGRGQKLFLRGWGVVLKARGVLYFFFRPG